jgi:hypothetical protein
VHFTYEWHFKMKAPEWLSSRNPPRFGAVPGSGGGSEVAMRNDKGGEVNTRKITIAMVVVLLFGLATGSVLLLGYAAAAGSILVLVALLLKRAMDRRTDAHPELMPTRALDLEDRKAA